MSKRIGLVSGTIPGVISALTSTAVLLNVRHAGAGRINGKPRGPADLLPCGVCQYKNQIIKILGTKIASKFCL